LKPHRINAKTFLALFLLRNLVMAQTNCPRETAEEHFLFLGTCLPAEKNAVLEEIVSPNASLYFYSMRRTAWGGIQRRREYERFPLERVAQMRLSVT
jgi:hypothetical protein